jgi:hypothetical protein
VPAAVFDTVVLLATVVKDMLEPHVLLDALLFASPL